jgi:hypothetical protein
MVLRKIYTKEKFEELYGFKCTDSFRGGDIEVLKTVISMISGGSDGSRRMLLSNLVFR